jgi:hypothetical protein
MIYRLWAVNREPLAFSFLPLAKRYSDVQLVFFALPQVQNLRLKKTNALPNLAHLATG